MRHRVHGRKLGRTSAHRKALFRNQLTALFTHERIVTTLAKAKELRPLAEKMVTLARTGTLPARRKVAAMISDRIIVRRLFDEIAPRFTDRTGGYTRIMKLGPRLGDAAEMCLIEILNEPVATSQETAPVEEAVIEEVPAETTPAAEESSVTEAVEETVEDTAEEKTAE